MKVLSGLSIPSFTGNKSLISDGGDYVAEGGATATEISRLSGVTSNIQTQLDDKWNLLDTRITDDANNAGIFNRLTDIAATALNNPGSSTSYLVNIRNNAAGSAYQGQLAITAAAISPKLAIRNQYNGSWTDWRYALFGSGTNNALSKFDGSGNLVDSLLYESSGELRSGALFRHVSALSTDPVFALQVSGENNSQYVLYKSGLQEWGNGTLSRDTNLFRSAANRLQTDDVFGSALGFRATGYSTTPLNGDGPGIEMHYDSANSRARVLAYDRTAAARVRLDLDGSPINFYANGSLKGAFDSSGNFSLSNLTASRVLISDSSKNIISSSVTSTELGYLSGATSSIQSALDARMATASYPDLVAIEALAGTSGLLRKTAANTWSLDTATYLTGNQTITLSGIVTGSGTTAITTAIADGALSIAKTSDLQSALDAKMATSAYPDLVAIETLAGTSGLLKKTAANTWTLDTSTYLLASANAVSATKLATARTLTIGASGKTFDGSANVSWTLAEIGAQSNIYKTVFSASFSNGSATAGWCKLGTYTGDSSSRFVFTITGKAGWNDQDYPSQAIIHGGTNYITADNGQIAAGCKWNELIGTDSTAQTIALVRKSGYSAYKFDLYVLNDSNYVNWMVEVTSTVAGSWITNVAWQQSDPGTGSNVFRPTKATQWDSSNLTNLSQLSNGPGYITGNQIISLSGDASGSGSTSIPVSVTGITVSEHSTNNKDYPVVWDNSSRSLFHTASKLKFNPSSGLLSVDKLYTSNSGNGTNIRIGDDLWLGDINYANTMSVRGVQNSGVGYIRFGSDSNGFGYNGSNLVYGNMILDGSVMTLNGASCSYRINDALGHVSTLIGDNQVNLRVNDSSSVGWFVRLRSYSKLGATLALDCPDNSLYDGSCDLLVTGKVTAQSMTLGESNVSVVALLPGTTTLPTPVVGKVLFLYASQGPNGTLAITAPSGYNIHYRSSGTSTAVVAGGTSLAFNSSCGIAIGCPVYNSNPVWWLIW